MCWSVIRTVLPECPKKLFFYLPFKQKGVYVIFDLRADKYTKRKEV